MALSLLLVTDKHHLIAELVNAAIGLLSILFAVVLGGIAELRMGVPLRLLSLTGQGHLTAVTVLCMGMFLKLVQRTNQLPQYIVALFIMLMGRSTGITKLDLVGDHSPTVLLVLMGNDFRLTADEHLIFILTVLVMDVLSDYRKCTAQGAVLCIAFLRMGMFLPLRQFADQLITAIIAHLIVLVDNKIYIFFRFAGQDQLFDAREGVAFLCMYMLRDAAVCAVRSRDCW
jgi:hypothetical protein